MNKSYLLFCSFLLWLSPICSQEYQFAPAEGVQLAYRIYGEGPPLLLLNGGPGFPSTHFGALAEKLAKGRKVILFDQRGTGKSRLEVVDSITITVQLMVKDIEALRRHLEIDSWMVMGHSWGGMYAMCYTAAHPDRVEGLVLSASGGIDLSFTASLGEKIRSSLKPEEIEQLNYYSANPNEPDARRKRVEAMAPAYVYHRKHVPTVVGYLARENAFVPEINRLVWQDLQLTNYNLSGRFSGFDRPVLILQGKQDIIGEEIAVEIAAAFSNAQLELIDECSHYLWLDQPEKYFATLEAFLK